MRGLLVFDWDGTLADSEARIVASATRAIEELGLPARSPAEIRVIIGLGLDEAVEALFGEQVTRKVRAGFVAAYRRSFLDTCREPVTLFEGARETLAALRQDYALAVATGKGRRGLDRDLEDNDLGALFDATRCADEAPSKPHPGMLLEIIEELDFAPGDALMIGDTDYDLQMAHAAGAPCVAVATGVHDRDRLLRAEPLALLDSVADLPGWLAAAD